MEDAPREGPDEEVLQGLLALALHPAEAQKRVRFPGFSWAAPAFVAEDRRVSLRFEHARLAARDEDGVRAFLLGSLPRLGGRDPPALLAIDARPSGLAEFQLAHLLYGEVTLFAHRARPHEPMDARIHDAREKGWTPTLKEHNLLPGRGLVVMDEHQGLLLREPRLDALPGVLLLTAAGTVHLWWNPFARRADPELQHWLAWGAGAGGPSEWRRVFEARRDADEAP